MSWLGDVGSFEAFNAKGMLGQVKDNPARLLYGSADPFSTKVWNGLLGTDDKPLVDQFGGAADHRYGEAEDAGINTGPGKSMHTLAKAIASIYAGGAASGAMSGGASTAGAAGGAGGTGYGIGQPVVSGGVGNASYAGSAAPSSGGFMGALNTGKEYYNAAKPYMDAAKTGMEMSGAMDQEQPQMQAPEVQQAQGGAQTMAQLATPIGGTQLQVDQQSRQRRRGLLRGGL